MLPPLRRYCCTLTHLEDLDELIDAVFEEQRKAGIDPDDVREVAVSVRGILLLPGQLIQILGVTGQTVLYEQSASGQCMACRAAFCWASAASNSWLPLRCSSMHLMRALSRSAAFSRRFPRR